MDAQFVTERINDLKPDRETFFFELSTCHIGNLSLQNSAAKIIPHKVFS